MPKGVAKDFLRILEGDLRAERIRLVVLSVAAALLTGLAWFLADRAGTWWHGIAAHVATLGLGIGLGLLVAHRRAHHLETSMRSTWGEWMKYSLACDTVGQLDRRVHGRATRHLPYTYAVVLLVVWALEVLVLAMALLDRVDWMALVAIGLNGLLVGGMLGWSIRFWRWNRMFRQSLDDMVAEGELGLWGVV